MESAVFLSAEQVRSLSGHDRLGMGELDNRICMFRTPRTITQHHTALAATCTGNDESAPVFIKCLPEVGAAYGECFTTVATKVHTQGGQPVLGWAIWELEHLWVTAEFHCVWHRPDGVLIDVSPRKEQHGRVLFVPDPNRFYDGAQVANINRPLIDDPDIHDFLALQTEHFRLMNEGDLQHATGSVVVDERVLQIEDEMTALINQILERYPPCSA
jgi:hypothetical protein